MKPAKAPAARASLEFKPQRKLDLPLIVLQLLLDQARGCFRRFRERAQLTRASIEYIGPQRIAAEVCMVEDVEELGPEFQHPAFSQEAELCLFHQ